MRRVDDHCQRRGPGLRVAAQVSIHPAAATVTAVFVVGIPGSTITAIHVRFNSVVAAVLASVLRSLVEAALFIAATTSSSPS
jgi:hypothetical protein